MAAKWGILLVTSAAFIALSGATGAYDIHWPPGAPGPDGLTRDQIRRIQQLTTAFENSDTHFQYGYIENRNDGRGYTAGRIGFCTGTGDLLDLVEIYTKSKPDNALARYLPELRKISHGEGRRPDQVDGLPGFVRAWKKTAEDPDFCKAQDEVVERLYFKPAMRWAAAFGLKMPIAKGFVFDTVVQHGVDGEPDSMLELMKKTTRVLHGTPKSGIDEVTWLKKFMEVRREDLQHPYNKATQKEWAESVERVDVYRRILDSGNTRLEGPIQFDCFGEPFTIR